MQGVSMKMNDKRCVFATVPMCHVVWPTLITSSGSDLEISSGSNLQNKRASKTQQGLQVRKYDSLF